jgi:cob(I)alamin adenosyltransferase
MAKGLIHVYTGEGKGKTTAAIGLAMRAAGQGKKVLMLQFLKSRVKDSGVVHIAKKSHIKVIKFKRQTTPLFDPNVNELELRKSIKRAINTALKEIKGKLYDLVVLDEFNTLFSNGYATIGDVKRIIEAKPDKLELVFTGRGAPKELIRIADYVTEMRMIKHPYSKGIKARKGVEF